MVSRKGAVVAAVAALAVGVGIVLQQRHVSMLRQKYSREFEEVVPGIKRLGYTWITFGGLLPLDVFVYLIKQGPDYILVDVAAPGADDILLSAVKEATKDGTLRLIMLTHGHLDHVAALPALVKAHPDAQILMHVVEEPFVAGRAATANLPADNFGHRLVPTVFGRANVSSALHPSRTRLLQGDSGDIADSVGPAGQAPNWAPPRGIITFVHTPGHARGHVSYVHEPSGSLLTGDVVAHLGQPPVLASPPTAFSWNNTQVRLDAKRLAGLDIKRAWPSHDHGMGVSPSDLHSFVAAL